MGTYPVVLGHEVVGKVVEASDSTLDRWGIEIGDRVAPEPYIPCRSCQECVSGHYHMCDEGRAYGVTIPSEEPPHVWGGYGEHVYLDPNTLVHPIDDDVPGRAACLASVIGNGVRWVVDKGRVEPGDSVAIIGPGAQGLATAVVADAAGADPIALFGLPDDVQNFELGKALGATHTLFATDEDVRTRAADIVDGGGFDVVVVAAPAQPAVRLAIDLVRPRGRIVQVGMLGSDPTLQLDDVVVDEISILGGRGQAGNVERAIGILERNADAIARINSHTFSVGDAETAINRQIPGEEYDSEIIHAALRPE